MRGFEGVVVTVRRRGEREEDSRVGEVLKEIGYTGERLARGEMLSLQFGLLGKVIILGERNSSPGREDSVGL